MNEPQKSVLESNKAFIINHFDELANGVIAERWAKTTAPTPVSD